MGGCKQVYKHLHEGEEEGEGCQVSLHICTISKGHPLAREQREDDQPEDDPLYEVLKVGEIPEIVVGQLKTIHLPLLQLKELVNFSQDKDESQYTNHNECDCNVISFL